MSYIKLKDFVTAVPLEDGSCVRNRRYEKSATMALYIEKTGRNRMFLIVPDFVGNAVPRFESYGCKLSHESMKTGTPAIWVLYGTSPDSLDKAWRSLVEEFYQSRLEVEVVPVILITMDEKASQSGNTARTGFDFTRYLKNTNTETRHLNRDVTDYQWDDDLQPKVARTRYHFRRGDMVELPYTEELWQRLCAFRDQVRTADERLRALVASGDIGPRLLAGGQLLLGSD